MTAVHQRLGVALVAVLAVAALGALPARHEHRLAVWRAYVRCCEAAVVVQSLLGLLLLAAGRRPHDMLLHLMYGAAVVVALPLAGRLAASTAPARERSVLGLGALAAALLALRAVLTGG